MKVMCKEYQPFCIIMLTVQFLMDGHTLLKSSPFTNINVHPCLTWLLVDTNIVRDFAIIKNLDFVLYEF